MTRSLRIGYVVKRFPRVSETFIAQEILQLERLGAEVQVFVLGENDQLAGHQWLSELRAEVHQLSLPFADAWSELAGRYRSPSSRRSTARTVLMALADPGRKGRRGLGQAVEIAQLAEARGLDHLHTHFASQPAATTLLAHQLCGVPFSVTAHAKDIWINPGGPDYWHRLARAVSFIVTVSHATREHVAGLVGKRHEDRVRHLYNGIDLRLLRPGPRKFTNVGDLRLLCVARLVPKKGIDVLLGACAGLKMAGIGFRLEVIGDGELASALKAQAAGLGLESLVQFHGALPHERIVAAMRTSDVFVLPCRIAADGDMDTLPTVLLEAMASGLPCISSPVGGVGEIIEHEVTGWLVPPDDPAKLAERISRLAGNPTTGWRMGRAGRRRAEQLFDVRQNVTTLHEWFLEAAGRDGVPRYLRQAGSPR